MIVIISPAKTLDFKTPAGTAEHTQPEFLKEAGQLMKLLRPLTLEEVRALLGVSEDLAALNAGRYGQWRPPFTQANAKQAVLAFNGDVYAGLDAGTLEAPALAFAQEHLRILSGLYGMLRPLDLIQAYRLEMGVRLGNARGRDLYAFWRERLTAAMNRLLAPDPVLVNLASEEYFKVLDRKALAGRIITPVFEDGKNGTYKVISFFAKRARGAMARHILQKRLQDPAKLKLFKGEGYAFDKGASEGDRWVFRR